MATQRKTKSKTSSNSRRSRKTSPDATELLLMELQNINSAERQLARVLPRLARACESETLRDCIEARQKQGEQLLEDLDSAFERLEESAGRRKNVAAEGLIEDLKEHLQEISRGAALDAVIVAGLQKTEHYCIAAWGTARAMAEAEEETETAQAMERALKEGRELDARMTQLSEDELLPALQADSEDEESEGEDEDSGESRSRRSSRESGREASR